MDRGQILTDDELEHLMLDHPQAAEASTEVGHREDPIEGAGAVVIGAVIGGVCAIVALVNFLVRVMA